MKKESNLIIKDEVSQIFSYLFGKGDFMKFDLASGANKPV